jgi:hypothetical protein
MTGHLQIAIKRHDLNFLVLNIKAACHGFSSDTTASLTGHDDAPVVSYVQKLLEAGGGAQSV